MGRRATSSASAKSGAWARSSSKPSAPGCPALGFGTWDLKGRACRRAVADAIDVGYRHIDTARMYGNEREVGQGVRDAGVARSDVFVVTKLWNDELRPDAVPRCLDDSLDKLDMAWIDLLLIHWPNPRVPIAETLAAMVAQRDAGSVRHIGVSNFDAHELEESIAVAPVLTEPDPLQPLRRHPRAARGRPAGGRRHHRLHTDRQGSRRRATRSS